jgi:hypothetical protein
LWPAAPEIWTAVSVATLLIGSRISASHPSPVAIALPTRPAGLTIVSRRTAHKISTAPPEKFLPRDFAITLAIELLEHLRCVLHFFGIDHAIVVCIEQIEQRRPTPAHIAWPTSALPVGAALPIWPTLPIGASWPTIARETLGGIGWLRRHILRRRSIFLRAQHRCRQRQRYCGKKKRLQVHRLEGFGVTPHPAASAFKA